MPWPPAPDDRSPLADLTRSVGFARYSRYTPNPDSDREYEYRFAISSAEPGAKPDGWLGPVREQLWFARAGEAVKGGGDLLAERAVRHVEGADAAPDGREWHLKLSDGRSRVVRVFLINGRAYYLSAEGPDVTPDEEHAAPFFNSFALIPPRRMWKR
jgi:hypothetical protein